MSKYYKEPQYIHYSNCHEDSEFALANMKENPARILTIASGLDNALAFLLTDPESVLAFDYNKTQVYLCRLKKCAVERLDYEQFLGFIGVCEADSGAIYDSIKEYLDAGTRGYFDSHRFLISETKLVNCGRFESYFGIFKKHILSKTHSKAVIDRFMNAPDLESQWEVYTKQFNNLRFRLLFKLFFSKAVMKRLGRDKDFFTYAKGGLSAELKKRFELCIKNNLNRDNPYLQYIVNGRMDSLPTYLTRENYNVIKSRIDRLEIREADFEQLIRYGGEYDFMYLSDIFEYMDEATTDRLAKDIYRALGSHGQVMLYNMMIERHISGLKETELDQTKNRTFYYLHCYSYEKD